MSRVSFSGDRAERGAVLIQVVVALVVLLGVAALVLDFAAIRFERASAQTTADSAVAAGAQELADLNGLDACTTTVDYLVLNTPGVTSFAGIDCSGFTTACSVLTPPAVTSGTSGNYTVTIQYPVPDSSPYLDPSAISAGSQAVSDKDGEQCDRLAVQFVSTHQTFFANVFGVTQQATTIRSVARADSPIGNNVAVNLLLLERTDCRTVTASGGGSGSSGIVVGSVFDPATGRSFPGLLASDSDGTTNCSSDGTMDAGGSGSVIRADGPPGCPSESAPGTGRACGTIRLFAPGTPGCNFPACTATGTIRPDPIALKERITREAVDHRFNCKATYPASYLIDGCDDPPDPNIDELIAALQGPGQPAGYASFTGAGYSCNESGNRIVPPGNWYVDCSLSVSGSVIFTGGNVVFANGFSVQSSGLLAVNTTAVALTPATNAAVAYVQSGEVKKAGQGRIMFNNTFVYFSPTSTVSMSGGSGALVWIAPLSGDFEDLALWSDSTLDHKLAGQANINLEGLFFTPLARVTYQGNGSQVQVAAQFISRKLEVGGNGNLLIKPRLDRAVIIPRNRIELIR